jgi:hypothetical protein
MNISNKPEKYVGINHSSASNRFGVVTRERGAGPFHVPVHAWMLFSANY